MLLDNRILKKQYGRVFESLPSYRRTTDLNKVRSSSARRKAARPLCTLWFTFLGDNPYSLSSISFEISNPSDSYNGRPSSLA